MKIVLIIPGSGGTFYCENCLRDVALVSALRRRGHDVIMVPMYLPLFTDEPGVAGHSPVFFGGITTWVRERLPWSRHLPAWLLRGLDARWLLAHAARRSESTRASGMGSMTLSMLRGDSGHHVVELRRLVEWLQGEGRPDLIQLSNALLLGLAAPLRSALNTPVVSLLQDEDVWLDALDKPFDRQCWEMVGNKCNDVDLLISVSAFYADAFGRKARVARDKIRVVHPGIDPTGLERAAPPEASVPVIGYLSKMTESLGLGILVDAFIQLKQAPSFSKAKLRAMGGMTGNDRRFIAKLRRKLDDAGFAEDAEFLPEMDRASRVRFLQSLTVLSVPVPAGVAFGTFMLEAMAAGVPVVEPDRGAFPEIINATGGGMVYKDTTAQGLARTLATLLRDPARVRDLAQKGKASVLRDFTVDRMAADLSGIYESLAARK